MSKVRLIDANALKYKNLAEVNGKLTYVLTAEEINNAPTVELNDKSLEIARKSIELGRSVGKLEGKLERPQGDCDNCDFRKFTNAMIDNIVDMMIKLGIYSLEDLQKLIEEQEAST